VYEFQNPAQVGMTGKNVCARALFGSGIGDGIVLNSPNRAHDDLEAGSKASWKLMLNLQQDRWQMGILAADLFGGIWLEASVLTAEPFAEMTRLIGGKGSRVGAQSSELLLPDLHSLPWEAIAEFRSHPACEDARSRLRGWEVAARNDPERTEAQGIAIL